MGISVLSVVDLVTVQNPMTLLQSLVVLKIRQRLNKVPLQGALGTPFVINVLQEQLLLVKIILKTLLLLSLLVATGIQSRIAMQVLLPVVERIKPLVTFLLLLVAELKQRMIDHWLLIFKKVGVNLNRTEKVHSRQLQCVLYSKLDKLERLLTILRLLN